MTRLVVILFKAFYDICLFQKRPQDVPASRELFSVMFLVYTAISAILSYPEQTVFIAVLTGLIQSLMLMLITWLFLYLRSVPERWLQTCTALAGTGVIFSVVASPLLYSGAYVREFPAFEAFIVMLLVILYVWSIAVMTHILKHALSSSYVLGILGSLTYVALIRFALQLVLIDPVAGEV
jgi:hypothetical protein